ncbi:hypothetical protein IVB38_17770 [Bradyrhizobium sp. 38]|nr:hypothetical protein [Bradyrhizobium sp. 38]MCK1777236.1 hypothetical protein [Bradyrhizobium sp. 132]
MLITLRTCRLRHPQAVGQQKLELVTKALAPMAEIRALMLEKCLAGKVLRIRIMDLAIAHAWWGAIMCLRRSSSPQHITLMFQPFVFLWNLSNLRHRIASEIKDYNSFFDCRPANLASLMCLAKSSSASFLTEWND